MTSSSRTTRPSTTGRSSAPTPGQVGPETESGSSGLEEWTIGDDALVAESQGHYDQAEYDRQLEQGV